MENPPLFDRLRRLSSGNRAGWAIVGILGAYILLVTRTSHVPVGPGVAYWPAWIALVVATVLLASLAARRLRPSVAWLRPVEAAAILALTAMVLTDLTMAYQPLRDLGIYLKAGQHFMAGTPVYLQAAITERPADLTNYPFLYPPPTLPVFATLAMLPVPVAQTLWVGFSLGLGLLALRIIGLPLRWLVFVALWPPLFQGLWVGNVAVPALALFALAPWLGAGLVAGAIFKSYTGILALWLARERRWSQLVSGVAAIAVLALLTLPIVGVGAWQAWIEALRLYQASQQNLPLLYGFGLPGFVPIWAFLALAAAAVLAALCTSGREGLARLGTATIVASPSLFGHGLLIAVPSMLTLRALWLWLAIGITSAPDGLQWWWVIGLIAASWFVPELRRPASVGPRASEVRTVEGDADEPLHPLAVGLGPWPEADLR
jgi:hypothetical protein